LNSRIEVGSGVLEYLGPIASGLNRQRAATFRADPAKRRGAPGRALLMSRELSRFPASALGVSRGAGELDADEGLITNDTGVVSRRDRV